MRLAHYLAQSSYITSEVNGIVNYLQESCGHSEKLTNFHKVTRQVSNKAVV